MTSKRSRTLVSVLVVLALVASVFIATPSLVPAQEDNVLTAAKVSEAPQLDGQAEDLWNETSPLAVNVSGGANNGSTTVTLKALYTDDTVFFLAQWADPTESLRRSPWQKQDDGTWMKLQTNTGDENTYYEDKLALMWNINNSVAGFNDSGCFVTCHVGEAPKPYGNKYTANPGETADLWHWKSVRTGPVGQVDDQYVDSTQYSEDAPEAGRHSDPSAGGGYSNNENQEKTMPAWTSADQPAPPYWILDNQKVAFEDTYNPSDEIAGIIVAPFSGDRADLGGAGVYADGMWTLEWGRNLQTGSQFDVQFADLSQPYYFGVATFDNAQVRHAFSSSALQLTFAGAEQATPTATETETPTPTAAETGTATPTATETPPTLPETGGPFPMAIVAIVAGAVLISGLGVRLLRR